MYEKEKEAIHHLREKSISKVKTGISPQSEREMHRKGKQTVDELGMDTETILWG